MCGCKEKVTIYKGVPRRFVHGHNKGNQGNKHSEEARAKMSRSHTGRDAWNKGLQLSDVHIQHISESKKGSIPWNKGLNIGDMGYEPWNKGLDMNKLGYVIWNKGIPQGEQHRENNSKSHMGQPAWNKGVPMSVDALPKLIKPRTDGYCDVWGDKEYKKDLRNSTCQDCGTTNMMSLKLFGRNLSLHHADGDKTNCHPDNFKTLCSICHAKADWVLRKNNLNNGNIREVTL